MNTGILLEIKRNKGVSKAGKDYDFLQAILQIGLFEKQITISEAKALEMKDYINQEIDYIYKDVTLFTSDGKPVPAYQLSLGAPKNPVAKTKAK